MIGSAKRDRPTRVEELGGALGVRRRALTKPGRRGQPTSTTGRNSNQRDVQSTRARVPRAAEGLADALGGAPVPRTRPGRGVIQAILQDFQM